MSTQTVSGIVLTPGANGLYDDVSRLVRTPTDVSYDAASDTSTLVFTPDLTAAEAAAFDDLVAVHRAREVSITLAEYRAIKADIATARAYVGLASPTAAQTAAALKSLTRIVGALLRS
jgi:hypothetical protein